MKLKPKFLNITRLFLIGFIIAFLFLFVFLDSVMSNSFNLKYFKTQYEKNEIYQVFAAENHTKENIDDITVNLFKYLKSKEDLEGDFFNEQEKSHLKDVRDLFKQGLALYYISIALFVILLVPFYLISRKQKRLSADFSIITLTTGGLILVALFVPLFFSFESFFMKFHEIFFTGNYLFPKTFNLVRLFPLQFFRSITKRIFMHTLIKSIALIIVGLIPLVFKLQEKQLKMNRLHSLKFGMKKK